MKGGGLLLKGKNPGNVSSPLPCVTLTLTCVRQIARQEDDIRAKMSAASDAYRKAVLETQAMRQEYFNFQLPRILRVRRQSLPSSVPL